MLRKRNALNTIERLEARRMLSAAVADSYLVITGTAGNDSVDVYISGTRLNVEDNGVVSYFNRAGLLGIKMNGLAGDDMLGVDRNYDLPVIADGGDGNDTINTGAANDLIIGGAGDDVLF